VTRETKINRAKEKARKTPCSLVGIDITSLMLTNEEKHQLIKEGFSISPTRYNKMILTYSQNARANDLREKVNKKIGFEMIKKELQKEETLHVYAGKAKKWLSENELSLTVENLRRYFDLVYHKIPSEKGLNNIYKLISKGGF